MPTGLSATPPPDLRRLRKGDGLGTAWGGERAEQALRDAGFLDVVPHALDDDPFNTYFVAHA